MPQFDPSSFSSQLFWLFICFGVLYMAMSKVFLPRIRDILKERHNNINNNQSIALQIQEQIDEIEEISKSLRETSASQYTTSINQSVKEAALEREQRLQDLRLQTAKMVEESKNQIIQFRENSQPDCQKIITQLIDQIGQKFFQNKVN